MVAMSLTKLGRHDSALSFLDLADHHDPQGGCNVIRSQSAYC